MSEALERIDNATGEIHTAPGVFSGPTYERSESIVQLAVALVKAQAAIPPALKTSDNPYFKSRYSDLATVWEAARGPLADNGLAVLQPFTTTPDGRAVQVTTLLVHVSGEWISSLSTWPARAEKDGGAVGPQALGSATTYGRRYGLAALLSIVSEDDDGERAEGRTGGPAKPAAPTKPAPNDPPKPPRRNQAAPAKPQEPAAPAPPSPAPPDPEPPPEPPANVAPFPHPPTEAPTHRAELLQQVSERMKDRLAGDKTTAAKVQLMKQVFGKEKWSEVYVLPIPQLITGLALLNGGA